MEGQPLEGRVLVDLVKPQSIDSIIVTVGNLFICCPDQILTYFHVRQVLGQIVCTLSDVSIFYSESKTLWKIADDDTPPAPNLLRLGMPKTKPKSKLGGQHTWPFTFVLPRDFQVDRKVARENKLESVELMPPNLNGKGKHSSIVYQVTLDVKRRGYFQGSSTYV